jgi:hypothetical protein
VTLIFPFVKFLFDLTDRLPGSHLVVDLYLVDEALHHGPLQLVLFPSFSPRAEHNKAAQHEQADPKRGDHRNGNVLVHVAPPWLVSF